MSLSNYQSRTQQKQVPRQTRIFLVRERSKLLSTSIQWWSWFMNNQEKVQQGESNPNMAIQGPMSQFTMIQEHTRVTIKMLRIMQETLLRICFSLPTVPNQHKAVHIDFPHNGNKGKMLHRSPVISLFLKLPPPSFSCVTCITNVLPHPI